jgi:hypothetical protein
MKEKIIQLNEDQQLDNAKPLAANRPNNNFKNKPRQCSLIHQRCGD